MNHDRQISMTALWAMAAWAGAVLVIVTGTVIGVGWADDARARMVGIGVLAFGFLLVALAVCLTVKVMIGRLADRLVGIVLTQGDAEQRMRQVPSLVRH